MIDLYLGGDTGINCAIYGVIRDCKQNIDNSLNINDFLNAKIRGLNISRHKDVN